jgi:RNA polymerase sigma-70 factor (ECF subfamily)
LSSNLHSFGLPNRI